MKHVRSFTIVEVIVVMLLSGIIISMGYTVLRMVQHQFGIFHQQSALLTTTYQFNKALKYDFKNAELVRFNTDSNLLELENFNKPIIKYKFMESSSLRISSKIDTFTLIAQNIEIKKIDSILPTNEPVISAIEISIVTPDNHLIKMRFSKMYPAKLFMDHQILN